MRPARLLVLAGLLPVAACAKSPSGDTAGGERPVPATDEIACALGGARDFSTRCTIERGVQEGVPLLVLRHPDGGFRRLIVEKDGSLKEADGAQNAVVAGEGETREISIGSDRYRLSAKQISHGP